MVQENKSETLNVMKKSIMQTAKFVNVGDICNLKITALAANNVGIDQYSFANVVFVANAKLGSQIKAKIVKVKRNSYAVAELVEQNTTTATIETNVYMSRTGAEQAPAKQPEGNKPGDILTVCINEKMQNQQAGIVQLTPNFRLIVPFAFSQSQLTNLQNVKVIVTRVKPTYAFAKILPMPGGACFAAKQINGLRSKGGVFDSVKNQHDESTPKLVATTTSAFASEIALEVGCKFTITINLNEKAGLASKQNKDFMVLKLKNVILFLKLKKAFPAFMTTGKLRVTVKILSKSQNCVVGKVLQINAISKTKKMSVILKSIDNMIKHGMHFGEKAVKCNANMKNYVWWAAKQAPLAQQGTNKSHSQQNQVTNQALFTANYNYANNDLNSVSITTEKIGTSNHMQMLSKQTNGFVTSLNALNTGNNGGLLRSRTGSEAKTVSTSSVVGALNTQHLKQHVDKTETGVGSVNNKTALLNLSVKQKQVKSPLIKKGRHVINLLKTRRCLNQALKQLTKYALKGRTFLFIGTKKPAAGLVARASFFTKNSFYVNTRWLGGMLTNWKTICKSISKIRPILKEKQRIIGEILERRQAIKKRLIKKALLLKQKSKLILNKGACLLQTLKNNSFGYLTNAKKLSALAKQTPVQDGSNDFINKGTQYVKKRQKLIQKRTQLIYETVRLKQNALQLWLKHKAVLNQLAIYAKKLRESKYLLILTSEIHNIKKLSHDLQNNNTTINNFNLLSVGYSKLKQVNEVVNIAPPYGLRSKTTQNASNINWILPNPPKEFLNKVVVCASEATKFDLSVQQQSAGNLASSTLINNKTNVVMSDAAVSEATPLLGRGASPSSVAKPGSLKFIVCSTLLCKFSGFGSYVKSVMKSLLQSIHSLQLQAKTYASQLNQIQATLQTYLTLKQKYSNESLQLKLKFHKERAVIGIVKRKLKTLEAQRKLLNFLPRLRYLPTPQAKISEIVQILLKRIVDPKLQYPIEQIYDQKLNTASKKLATARKKKWQRLLNYFGGIANMTKLTKTQISRNIAIIIGQNEEINAVRECQKLGIKMFTVVDTDCNPTLSDHIIPANNDSRSSIKYILTKMVTRIRLAQKLRSRLSIYVAK